MGVQGGGNTRGKLPFSTVKDGKKKRERLCTASFSFLCTRSLVQTDSLCVCACVSGMCTGECYSLAVCVCVRNAARERVS